MSERDVTEVQDGEEHVNHLHSIDIFLSLDLLTNSKTDEYFSHLGGLTILAEKITCSCLTAKSGLEKQF